MRPWILNSPRTTEAVCELIKTKPTDGKWQVSVEKVDRRAIANRRHFAILGQIKYWMDQRGQKHSVETWHMYFSQLFLEPDTCIIKGQMVCRYHSKDLSIRAFWEFDTKIEAWAANEGITILDEQEWAEFRRGQ